MSSGDIKAGGAYVELFANDSKLSAGLKAAGEKLKAFGSQVAVIGAGIAAAGTAILAPILQSARVFADTGSQLNDMSVRTGMSVEALSELRYAAAQTGASLGDIEASAKRMARVIVDAGEGSKSAADSLALLGLTAARLKGLKPEEQFELIAKRMTAIADPTLRAAAAQEIFGRSGTRILPMIADMDALTQTARRLGLVMSTEDSMAADALGDAIDTLKDSFTALEQTIGAAVAPMLTDMLTWITELIATTTAWVDKNRELVVVAMEISGAIAGIGTVVGIVGGGIVGLGFAMTGLRAIMIGMPTVIRAVQFAMAALGGPVGIALAVAAVAAAASALYLFDIAAESAEVDAKIRRETAIMEANKAKTKIVSPAMAETSTMTAQAVSAAIAKGFTTGPQFGAASGGFFAQGVPLAAPSNPLQERTAKATEATAANTAKIADKLDNQSSVGDE